MGTYSYKAFVNGKPIKLDQSSVIVSGGNYVFANTAV